MSAPKIWSETCLSALQSTLRNLTDLDLCSKTSFHLVFLKSHYTMVLVALHSWTLLWVIAIDILIITCNREEMCGKMHQMSSWKWRCLNWILFSDNAWNSDVLFSVHCLQWWRVVRRQYTDDICKASKNLCPNTRRPGLWNNSNSIQKHWWLHMASRTASAISFAVINDVMMSGIIIRRGWHSIIS